VWIRGQTIRDWPTLYDGQRRQESAGGLTIPAAPGGTQGNPTGIVFSAGMDFVVKGKTACRRGWHGRGALHLLFRRTGVISGWAPNVNTADGISLPRATASPAHAIYKGLALGGNGTTHLPVRGGLHNGRVDVFDGAFMPVPLPAWAFKDSHLPHGYACRSASRR